MEDTLTCTPTTFSQVFGRQGQLMQASKYLRSVTLGPKNMCFARLCQFAGLGVVNIKSRLSACLWSVKALLVHCKSWSRLGTQHAERKPAFLPRCFQPANELHTVKKCVCVCHHAYGCSDLNKSVMRAGAKRGTWKLSWATNSDFSG